MAKRNEFKWPYIGIDDEKGFGVLYSENGDHSVIIKIENPVLQYSADPESYYTFHSVFENIIRILGPDYVLQKQDVLSRKRFIGKLSDDYLTQKYNDNFNGKEYTDIESYLIITKQSKKRFYQYDAKAYKTFLGNVIKVNDVLASKKMNPIMLDERAISIYTKRVLAMDFINDNVVLNNFRASDEYLSIGEDVIKSISLINIDELDLPSKVAPNIERNDLGIGFPVDTMSFLQTVPAYQIILYNQVIFIPDQRTTLNKLEVKKKRHSSVPDPANDMSVEDIDNLMTDVNRENQLLVDAHYNIVIRAAKDNIGKSTNYIEKELFTTGIIPSRNAYNQLELFKCALPGNTAELKKYDKFLTTADAGLCFFFKERLLKDEDSDFKIMFSDRQGIPVAINTSDVQSSKGRLNNSNKFVLGPSGSGKSFFMNHLVRQYTLYNTDIILVDTGHSYSGLCAYYKGKYITYSEERPITMNPFLISQEEYNEEKRDFLKSLVCLLWKGADGSVTQVEDAVISQLIVGYYEEYFSSKEDTRSKLSFNGFYEYAANKIPDIMKVEEITFPLQEFKYILKKFYKGGEYGVILNDDIDSSLFDEQFIVFEIDAIKENKVLFPIVTIIIMDVFLQKMRHKSNRKALIIEEAWKAIASPMMAGYILYVYKTVRKFLGEAIVVTQELDDIIGNAVVKDSIINNSDTICLLDQTKFKDNFDEIAKLLAISPVEKNKIFTINRLEKDDSRGQFKEVYIKRGGVGEVYGVENSFEEYMIFTTDRAEKEALQLYLRVYHDVIKDGLEAFVRDMKNAGLNKSKFCTLIHRAINDDRYTKGPEALITAYSFSGQTLYDFISETVRTAKPIKRSAA
jgi:conjugation system TraG family ATPase